jgi:DNA processing protein
VNEIPSWWAGAMEHVRGASLVEAARANGGFDALIARGERALVAAGVAPDRARAWVRSPPRRTRGLAITLADTRYPARLRAIANPPPVLCVEGDPAALSAESALAIVGTRGCTPYGIAVARALGRGLAQAGVVVVSGLARGIDSHAHRGALSGGPRPGGGRTVAVLAHGLSFTAPPSNRELRSEIVARGGAVVSAWPDSFEPRPWTFPERNAWISGLADGVVVVEAPRRSGALHTVSAAMDQDRGVFVVPGPIGAETSRGTNDLLGAPGVEAIVDVGEFVSRYATSTPPLVPEWLAVLFRGASLDVAARASNRSVTELLVELGRMEARGEVVRLPGQRYADARSPA